MLNGPNHSKYVGNFSIPWLHESVFHPLHSVTYGLKLPFYSLDKPFCGITVSRIPSPFKQGILGSSPLTKVPELLLRWSLLGPSGGSATMRARNWTGYSVRLGAGGGSMDSDPSVLTSESILCHIFKPLKRIPPFPHFPLCWSPPAELTSS